ncbi:DUF6049 family protein [Streptomyces sp. NPDC054933]
MAYGVGDAPASGQGSAAGARGHALRAVVLVSLAALLGGLIVGPLAMLALGAPRAVDGADAPASRAPLDSQDGGSAAYPVGIVLDTLSPAVPKPDAAVTVTGRLVNNTTRQITGAHLGVRVDQEGEIAGHTEDVASLVPGESLPFTLKVPVSALGLSAARDYRFSVALVSGDGTVLGLSRTHLPWYPPNAGGQPLNVAVLWPLTDTPHMEAVSLGTGENAKPVFRDDALAGEFKSGGRLRQVVAAGAGLPVTWVADPGLLDEAKSMASGYQVAKTPDSSNPQDSRKGTGDKLAAAWLTAVKSAVNGQTLSALPYADPDLASIAHNGSGGDALTAQLGPAVRLGGQVTASTLGGSARTDVAWPYGGAADRSIVSLTGKLRLTTVVSSGAGLSTGTSQPRVSLGGATTALVGDPASDAVLQRDLSGEGDVVGARQELLGDLLDAQRRSPDAPGGLVVVPPRQLTGQAAQALSEALRSASAAGWIHLVAPDQVSDKPPPASVGPVSDYPQELRDTELSTQDIKAVDSIQPDLDALAQVLSDPDRTTGAVHRAMLRAVSTGWRANTQGAESYSQGAEAYVDNSITSVHLLPKVGTVTVAGGSASVPVTVANGLQQGLAGLELRIRSSMPSRLTVDNPVIPISAPPAANHTEQIKVEAHTNGPVQVTARLYTKANGRPWGDPLTFRVTVAKFSLSAVAIIAGGVLLALLAGAYKMRQARRADRL